MKTIVSRIVIVSFAVIMCVLMLPGMTYAASTAGGVSDEWVYTLAYQKKLDLSKAGLNIKLTDDEKNALKDQAEEEFNEEVDYVFGGVMKDAEEFEQTSGIPLKKDGEYNPEWDAAWNEAHPSYQNELYQSYSDYFKLDIKPSLGRELYQKVGGGSLSKYRLYLRLDLMAYLQPVNYSKISDFDAWKEKTLKYGQPAVKTGDTQATIRYGWGNVGTTEWFERIYDYYKCDTGDESLTEAVEYMRDGYIYARYSELETDLLNQKIGDSLKNVKFDFYVEEVPEGEQDQYGIGTKYTRSDADYTVEAGGFKEGSDGKEPDKVFLSTVDFGSEDQFYDEDLTEKVQQARSATGADRDSAIQSLYTDIGDSDLSTHLVLYDGASYESFSYPHLTRAGTFTNDGTMIWPYAAGSSPFQGGQWNFESLAKYEMFGGKKSRTSDTKRRFSFYSEMGYTGINGASRSGYDLYFPEFDSEGDLISVSKPLVNGIVTPTEYAEKTNPVYDQITEGKADGVDLENLEYGDDSYGKFDKLTLKKQFADAEDADHTIRRYIVKEGSDEVTINGKTVKSDTDQLILDVTPVGQIMIFSSVAEADDFYRDYDLEINKKRSYWSPRFTKVKANAKDNAVLSVPSATYSNSTEEPEEPDITDPVVDPEADVNILVRLDGYNANKSLIDQKDMTQFGLTLYNAADSLHQTAAVGTTGFLRGSKVKDLSVDKNGYASLEGLKPGKYVLVETKNPDGTRCVKTQYDLEIRNVSGRAEILFDGKIIKEGEYAIVNNEISKLSVEKKDGSDGYVKGAGLELVDGETGETVDSWTTAERPHKVAALKFDHPYTIKEKSVPSGYQKADDVSFRITDGSVKEITMIDKVEYQGSDGRKSSNHSGEETVNSPGNHAAKDSAKNSAEQGRSVRTGDSSGLYKYAALLIIAVLLVTALMRKHRRSGD
ncbi:MAG: MSCRAMM family protein [Anaerovoracaceae bacterium]|jgi:hypothetical protein